MLNNPNSKAIETNTITFGYTGGLPLQFAPLVVDTGEHCLILGDSGSGKTTLLHLLCGLLSPLSGTIRINGTALTELSGKNLDRFRGQHIGIVFQQAHLIRSLTVLENLSLAQSFAGISTDKAYKLDILDRLAIADKAHHYPQELSQGQIQRAAIARAVVNHPKLLVADEPTSALDDKNADRVLDLLLSQAKAHQASLIIATHDKRVKNSISKTYQL